MKKSVTYRIESELIEEFKGLSKALGYRQTDVISGLIRMGITEMRERKEAKEKARKKAIKSMVKILTPTP